MENHSHVWIGTLKSVVVLLDRVQKRTKKLIGDRFDQDFGIGRVGLNLAVALPLGEKH